MLVFVPLASEKALDRVKRGPGEGKRERQRVREGDMGWNNKGRWKMTSLVKEVFLKAPLLTEEVVPWTRQASSSSSSSTSINP